MQLAAGQAVDPHDVAIETEGANLTFRLARSVRTKVLRASQQTMQAQV